jgi:RNA methyltransferase, TrmH family
VVLVLGTVIWGVLARTMYCVPDVISSTKNPIVRSFVRLHRQRTRRETNQILIEGPTVFAAAIAAGAKPLHVLAAVDDTDTQSSMQRFPEAAFHFVGDHVLKAASDTTNPQSPVAIFTRPDSSQLSDRNVVVLVDISDPGNVGTVIRTAAALGWDVAVSHGTADVWSPKVLRAGVGTHFATSIVAIDSMETAFAETAHTLVGTVVSGGQGTLEISRPIALLIGSEAHGLPQDVLALTEVQMTIPMPGGTESLNAAVAAALGMWISMHVNERPG